MVRDGKLERRAVKTGPPQDDGVLVLSSLAVGEKVVTSGPPDLRDGESVKEKNP